MYILIQNFMLSFLKSKLLCSPRLFSENTDQTVKENFGRDATFYWKGFSALHDNEK